jgi:hypothetical protein
VASVTILDAIAHPQLFGPSFQGPSWATWTTLLAGLSGLPMTAEQAGVFARHTGRSSIPTVPARELWMSSGRRSGKTLIMSALAVFLAALNDYRGRLGPGEKATVLLLSADRRQSRVSLRYVKGLLQGSPVLAPLIETETKESIELTNGTVIEVGTSSFRSTRGYSLAAVLCDEIAFWNVEADSANADSEVITALRPALANLGGLLLCISSPYARRGALFQAIKDHHGKNDDPVLTWVSDTRSMNPTIRQDIISEAFEDDESAAWSEWGRDGEVRFRSDIESFVGIEVVERAIEQGVRERGPLPGVRYHAFLDPAGGSGQDSFTLAVAHREKEDVAVLDCVREVKPPFSPEAVVKTFVDVLREYRVGRVTGDRYAGSWPSEAFGKHRVLYVPSDKNKSELYGEALPLLNSGRAVLLDQPRLKQQILGLERRASRGGKDSIDHSPGAHDDVANAACGALLLASVPKRKTVKVAPQGAGPRASLAIIGTLPITQGFITSQLGESGPGYLYD